MRRELVFFLLVGALRLIAVAADATTAAISASDPLILQVQVVEGEGLTYLPGSRAVKGITVRVTDEVGRPVAGAAVSFRLPDDGATGLFQNNSKAEIAATGADGRASVWGMRWGKVAGTATIRITAAKGSTRAGTTATQVISLNAVNGATVASNQKAYKSHGGGGGGRKWLWFALAGAGAAGGGIAAYEVLQHSGSAASGSGSSSAPNTVISPPQVTVGPPH